MRVLAEDLETAIESLISSAGVDPRLDSYTSGVIAALRTIIETEFLQETD